MPALNNIDLEKMRQTHIDSNNQQQQELKNVSLPKNAQIIMRKGKHHCFRLTTLDSKRMRSV